jgi:ubiquinone/menaquinone biosynthesis C-methylase UbiE
MAKSNRAVQMQRSYYAETAARYDVMHANETSTDKGNAKFLHAFLRMVEARSLLDVGTATGLGMRELKAAMPELSIYAVEPVRALLDQGRRDGNMSSFDAIQATGEALPFADGSFDAVCEFGILHHAANPAAIVREMLRVARKAVFICDCNRFGQGSMPARLLKVALYKTGLWPLYIFLRTRGKGYMISKGDGVAYSYSVYDSLDLVHAWADRMILIPTSSRNTGSSWLHPLLTSEGAMICGFKGSAD